jgi:hypothetical protein
VTCRNHQSYPDRQWAWGQLSLYEHSEVWLSKRLWVDEDTLQSLAVGLRKTEALEAAGLEE